MMVRRFRRWALAGATAAALTATLAPGARAAGAAPASGAAQPTELARMRYRQGVEAYRGGRYRESIDYFLEADRLAPSAALSFNIARAYEKIDDPAAALRWYRDYLRRDPTTKDRTETESLIHGFEGRLSQKGVQQVTVLSDPPGATVLVDGHAAGVTPWTAEIAPGPHQLELQMDGHAPATQALDVPADHATDVALTLTAAIAKVAEPEKPGPAAPATPPGSTAEKARSNGLPLTTMGWIGVGAGGAALTGALVFELLRRGAESHARKETTQVGYADQLDTMQGRQTAARVLAGTGAALAITGGILLWVGKGKEHPGSAPAISAACLPGTCWSTVLGRF